MRFIHIYFIYIALIVNISFAESSWIEIGTVEELQKIGKISKYPLNGNYYLANTIDASTTQNWNDEQGFEPIGFLSSNDAHQPFTGYFDGRGFTVRNLVINRPGEDNTGVFYCLGVNAHVYNLIIENIYLVGENSIGSIAGMITENSTISNCSVSGKIVGTTNVGGATGIVHIGSMIERCSSSATIEAQSKVGNMVGLNFGNLYLCDVGGCINGDNNCGGLVGVNGYMGIISQCSSTASVMGNTSLGGLVGTNDGNAYFCTSSGNVSGTNHDTGGLVGYNREGSIIEQNSSSSAVDGNINTGGLIGKNSGIVSNCFAQGSVDGNNINCGGLVGQNSKNGYISKCYTTDLTIGPYSDTTGGFAGVNEGTIENSFWDTETSGLVLSASGIGKTTSEMMTRSTFSSAEWNFETIWNISDHLSYPFLYLPPINASDIDEIATITELDVALALYENFDYFDLNNDSTLSRTELNILYDFVISSNSDISRDDFDTFVIEISGTPNSLTYEQLTNYINSSSGANGEYEDGVIETVNDTQTSTSYCSKCSAGKKSPFSLDYFWGHLLLLGTVFVAFTFLKIL